MAGRQRRQQEKDEELEEDRQMPRLIQAMDGQLVGTDSRHPLLDGSGDVEYFMRQFGEVA